MVRCMLSGGASHFRQQSTRALSHTEWYAGKRQPSLVVGDTATQELQRSRDVRQSAVAEQLVEGLEL